MSEDTKKMAQDVQDRIREVSYQMWESAGRQVDKTMEYWLAAKREVRATMEVAAKKMMPSAAKKTEAKATSPETKAPPFKTKAPAKKTAAPEAAGKKTGYKIEQIEGIGPAYATKLATVGIETTDDLLVRCGSAEGREKVAKQTGLAAKQILKWANMADLMRISGVGGEYAELLEAAGVDTVKELRTRNAENLAAKMVEINAAKKLTRRVASAKQVAKWLDQAKALDPKITH